MMAIIKSFVIVIKNFSVHRRIKQRKYPKQADGSARRSVIWAIPFSAVGVPVP